jgi:hypothetical protein
MSNTALIWIQELEEGGLFLMSFNLLGLTLALRARGEDGLQIPTRKILMIPVIPTMTNTVLARATSLAMTCN